jgi:hypothetical protein
LHAIQDIISTLRKNVSHYQETAHKPIQMVNVLNAKPTSSSTVDNVFFLLVLIPTVLNKTILDNALNAEDSMTEKMATVL